MISGKRMKSLAEAFEVELSAHQLQQLDCYAELLLEWNKKMNLTAITQPEEIETKHFLDSLVFASQPEVKGKLADVGSGAGFPGAVAALLKQDLQASIIEPNGKRLQFLAVLSAALGLNLDLVKERAEEAARKKWRESYDVCTARAVAALPVLCEYCLPLVKPGGLFIAMKARAEEELEAAKPAIERLGGQYVETRQYHLPDGAERSLIVIRKVSPTPPAYPRNGGVIAKRPLK